MEVSLQSFKKRFTYDPQKDLLGKGGFGEVYKAYDTEDHIFVALKISQGTADDKYNLISEIKRFKKLNHPNIVKHIEAYEVTGGTDFHGNPLIRHVGILEYADRGTLADLLKKGKPDYRLMEDLATDIIEGLAYLHKENIIHRDLKPTNILLFSDGEKLRAKITDFGIAKNTDATAVSTQLVGTVEYMAPEFFTTGNITPASDVWSLGVMLLEALTGTHPFGKTTEGLSNQQIINNILNADLANATQNLIEPLKQIVTKCLLREQHLRPQSAEEVKNYGVQTNNRFTEKTQLISKNPPERLELKWFNSKVGMKFSSQKSLKHILVSLIGISIIAGLSFITYDYLIESRAIVPFYTSTGFVGFKNAKDGNVIIAPNYVYADSFYEGRAKVIIDGKFGYINKKGKIAINATYDEAKKFCEGLAAVGKKNEEGEIEWGYIDKNGKEIVRPQYYHAENFEDGFAQVSLSSYGKDGIIDKKGNEVIPLSFKSVYLTDGGLFKLYNDNYALFSKKGKQITEFEYDNISENDNGLYSVRKLIGEDKGLFKNNYKYGWINTEGKEVIPIKYDWACDFERNVAVVQLDKKYYLINEKGETLPLKYDRVGEVSQGLVRVGNLTSDTTGLIGFIDRKGNEVIPLIYDDVRFDFMNGVARVRRNGKWGFIDTTGRAICRFEYESVDYNGGKYLSVRKDKFEGLINRRGETIIPISYNQIYDEPDEFGMLLARKNGYWGVIDTNGKVIIPFKYERNVGTNGEHGLYHLGLNGKYGVVDYNGNVIVGFIENGYHSVRGDQIIEAGHIVPGGSTGSRVEVLYWFNRRGKIIKEFN